MHLYTACVHVHVHTCINNSNRYTIPTGGAQLRTRAHARTNINTNTNTHTYTHTKTQTHTRKHTSTHTHTHTHTRVRALAYKLAHTCTHEQAIAMGGANCTDDEFDDIIPLHEVERVQDMSSGAVRHTVWEECIAGSLIYIGPPHIRTHTHTSPHFRPSPPNALQTAQE